MNTHALITMLALASSSVAIAHPNATADIVHTQDATASLTLRPKLSCHDRCAAHFAACLALPTVGVSGGVAGIAGFVVALAVCTRQLDRCDSRCPGASSSASQNPPRCSASKPCAPTHFCDETRRCRPKQGPGSQEP